MATNSAGIRITQAGISVPYAADYQYVFNSDWPSLAIAYEAVILVPLSTGSATIQHPLGFLPFVIVWDVTGGKNNGRVTNGIIFNKTSITINNTTTSDLTVSIKCYNLDISKAANYVLPQFPILKTPYDSTTGIKVTKYSKSISSNDLRDYILHSRAQSPAVLNIITEPTSQVTSTVGAKLTTYTITYTNPAGYIPWAFGFTSNDGKNYQIVTPGPSQNLPSFNFSYPITGNSAKQGQVVLQYSNNGSGTTGYGVIVVLRDPLIVANSRQVTY